MVANKVLLLAIGLFASFISASPAASPVEANAATEAANPKANEYRTGDCSGGLNYGHQPGWGLTCVHMDHTTHSVYIAQGDLNADVIAFAGDNCDSDRLGSARGSSPCVNVDNHFGQRFSSLQFSPRK